MVAAGACVRDTAEEGRSYATVDNVVVVQGDGSGPPMAKAGCRNGVAATVLRTCRRARCGIGGAAAALLAGLCNAESSQASAFFIHDQSAAALGNAFAGATAGADDITYTFFNGAALSRQQGSQAAFVGTSILAGTKFQGGAASTVQGCR
jgi:hypothetical protein